MTDLSITATQVLPGTGADATFEQGVAGAALTAGQPVYKDPVALTWKPADNDLSADSAVVRGIALHAASAGQPIRIQTGGDITLGAAATLVVGTVYALSATAGGICPIADLVAGKRVSLLGVGKTASVLQLRINNTGIQVAA